MIKHSGIMRRGSVRLAPDIERLVLGGKHEKE
jgi:hypothetical protein